MHGKRNIIKAALRDTVPVLAGYIVLGMGFGILMKSKGLGLIPTLCMSIFIYAGSMQYVAVGLLSGGVGFINIAVSTLIVNARHLFYGISVLDKYKNTGISKPYLIFSLTDETYSLVVSSREDSKRYYVSVSLLNHLYWVTGSALGSFVGYAVEFNTQGINFALTALFITIFTDLWIKNKNHLSAVSGVVVSVACLLIFGREYFLIPTLIIISALLILIRKKEEPKYDK